MKLNTYYRSITARRCRLPLVIILLLFSGLTVAAQDIPKKAKKSFDKAEYHIGLNEFEPAREHLESAIRAFPDYTQARLYLADIHFHQKRFEEAIPQYEQVRRSGPHASRVELFMARSYFKLDDFGKCIELIREYLENDRISENARVNAEQLLANAEFSLKAAQHPLDFSPENLGPKVNSPDHEYMPALSADGTTVIFTRLIRGQEDLYLTARTDSGWLMAEPLDEEVINTGHNEGAHCISADGKTLLYTICNERFTRGSCDLYVSRKRDGKWTAPVNLGPPVNSVSWDSQPTLSADGQTVYFVSNRRGGYGGFDIYSTRFRNGRWTEPANLGPVINTPKDEQTPFIHFDNRTLYFSSDGHPGMGRQDIFVSRLNDGTWTKPVNLGYPLNTEENESGMHVSLDGETAYYAAERESGFGGMDLYEFAVPDFARPDRVTYVRAKITDSETGKPVEAEFKVTDLSGDTIAVTGTSVDGEFLVCLPSGSDYSLHITREGYVLESMNFALKDTVQRKAYVLDVSIRPLEPGQVTVLRNVFFETDSHELLPASETELMELVELLNDHPELRLEISGHTDNRGSREYNMALSERRAKSVVRFLTEKGIDPQRLEYKGYGPDQPVAENTTAAGRAANRRTEFKVIE